MDKTDIVVLWVDGNDPQWQAEKKKYQTTIIDDTNSDNRFRDWGLMRYWFRSIEAFAPWVRTIHFITCGHVPDFLNLSHPKLHLVLHSDYLPLDSLPTFNACAIEMNIHRIPGIANQFVLFNDDMFFLRPVSQDMFFRNGLPCAEGSEDLILSYGLMKAWKGMAMNDIGLINMHFSKREAIKTNRRKYLHRSYSIKHIIRTIAFEKLYPNQFVGFRNAHAPAAFLKETFETIWETEPKALRETTYRKFRDLRDVNQWLPFWWQIASGQFYPNVTSHANYDIDKNTIETICRTIKSQSLDSICLNDPDWEIPFEQYAAQLQTAFEIILPQKSAFEK